MSEMKSVETLLGYLTPEQKVCPHTDMLSRNRCKCGAPLDRSELRLLRRMNSESLLPGWEQKEPDDAQAKCEIFGHGKITFIGYARAGEKRIPHRIGQCENCGLERPRLQFKELARRAGRLSVRRTEKSKKPAVFRAGYLW